MGSATRMQWCYHVRQPADDDSFCAVLYVRTHRYVALWDGDGVVDVRFDATVSAVGKNRLEFDYTPTANMDCWATGAAYCGDNVSQVLRLL